MAAVRRLGVVMNPIADIQPAKDSTLALLLAAAERGWELQYMEPEDLCLSNTEVSASMRLLEVTDDLRLWFTVDLPRQYSLATLDAVLMRLDPPFNMRYIYTTHLLEIAQQRHHVPVINSPRALRDCNEKIFATMFPDLCPATLVTGNQQLMMQFLSDFDDIVIKPLGLMGGQDIHRIKKNNPEASALIANSLAAGEPVMAQRFIPEIRKGDKRVFVIGGEAVPWMLARIPVGKDGRGNLVAGARGEVQPLGATEQAICRAVAPELQKRGILIAGLDIIGDNLTEINITCPTGIREIFAGSNFSIAEMVIAKIEAMLR